MKSQSKFLVCVIGASGFLGGAICKELSEMNIKWIGVSKDNLENIYSINSIKKNPTVIRSCTHIINAAGALKPASCEKNPYNSINNFFETIDDIKYIINQTSAKKFLHLSSAGTVYGEYASRPFIESDELKPISIYGKIKNLEELYFADYTNQISIEYLCARVSNPYGNKNILNHGFIDVLINSCLLNKDFLTYIDIENRDIKRDFIYSQDMATMLIRALFSEHTGHLNIANGSSTSLIDVINYIKNKKDVSIIKSIHREPWDIVRNELYIDKLIELNLYIKTNDIYTYIDSRIDKHQTECVKQIDPLIPAANSGQ